jgi:hypothetical protein
MITAHQKPLGGMKGKSKLEYSALDCLNKLLVDVNVGSTPNALRFKLPSDLGH